MAPQTKTHKQYLDELKQKHGKKILPVEKYVKGSVKILHRCDQGHEYRVSPNSVLGNSGCRICSRNESKKTDKTFRKELYEKHGDSILALEVYSSSKVKIKFKCSNGHTWNTLPRLALTGKGCPECNIHTGKSHSLYCDEIEELHNGNVAVISEYKNAMSKVRLECNVCRHVWTIKPVNSKGACPKCVGKGKKKWSHKEYLSQLKSVHGNKIKPTEIYVGASVHIEHTCKEGHKWYAKPVHVLQGYGCLECSKKQKFSTKDEYYYWHRQTVTKLTEIVYAKYIDFINPKRRQRSRYDYHLDHRYSIHDGYYNPKKLASSATLQEVCHPCNLRIISSSKNSKKNKVSSLSLTELRKRIRVWNKENGNPFKCYNGSIEVR